ncbi:hypothetical protein E1B28_012284 [Marasmius oreades]|uniref:Zn(2)-C6 fungal-type domain-containing protein n=1 Tax=Marasmius oreades TaxID=181124 RepID=A0A9P7RRZ4_9AGAR|nr:uncharacterized protein E1B28_012284 [Marasmius oreades]KAG7088270.1 hypothetical protein E1B28_012284 [Marasmius oreades]
MSPSAIPLSSDSRPAKRSRKAPPSEDSSSQFPVDHIFISEGHNPSKKLGGKKATLSCCECRRLKLKCDRTFPCGSCKKRGVSDICPDGVLVSGKGTRFILANTEQLHTKIHEMSERIRRLEDALESSTAPHHPLLSSDLLSIKSTMELYGTTQGKPDSRTPEHQSDHDHDLHDNESVRLTPPVKHEPQDHVDAEIQRSSRSFPLTDGGGGRDLKIPLRDRLQRSLPSRADADYLWDQTRQNALWQYNPHTDETFYPNLAHHCYATPPEELSTRRLALLFMILAIGCKVDIQRHSTDSPDAEHYHTLARAALSEVSVLDDTTVETITALFYEIWYLLVFSDHKTGGGHAWGLMGLTAKLAQSIGLHRNGTKSKVIPEEVERRRSLFWELLYLDARLSLSLGRPPSLSVKYMDCKRPTYIPDADSELSQSSHYYQEWKHSCYIHCLAPVLDAISQPGLEYSTVLSLDRTIRDFSIPAALGKRSHPGHTVLMQKTSHLIALETVILQLHRSYFMRALSGPEEAFNRRHRHAPSVVAVFLSATRMIATVEQLYNQAPKLTVRIAGYWSNAFSAAVALCLLVSRAPFTCLSPAALQELERARLLFRAAASPQENCPRARQVEPVLQTMIAKANDIFRRWFSGQEVPTMVLRHTDDHSEAEFVGMGTPPYIPLTPGSPSSADMYTVDPFQHAHRNLKQCIAEVHERAKVMFPMRKPCQCSVPPPSACPPSHSWAPPPQLDQSSPVLPYLYPNIANPLGFTTPNVGNAATPAKFAGMESVNFELGALHPNTEQSWMAWF